jgi:hypothetical protein
VIHSTTTRGQEIQTIQEKKSYFSCNVLGYGDVIDYHCLSLKSDGSEVEIRTGFHETLAGEADYRIPTDWESMENANHGYQLLKMKSNGFFPRYEAHIKRWKEEISEDVFVKKTKL